MTDNAASPGPTAADFASLDAALDAVTTAARIHLNAVKAADGAPDDDAVWNAYVALNNAAHSYDELLNDVFGEVTPWDLEEISADEVERGRVGTVAAAGSPAAPAADPYPLIVSVRQRRDYRVPSVSALVQAATQAREILTDGEGAEPVKAVAEAVLELMQAGDRSLAMLDIDELEPLDGVVVVVDCHTPFDPDAHDPASAEAPFALADVDRITGRFNERAMPDLHAG